VIGYLGIGCMTGVMWHDMNVHGNGRNIPLSFGAINRFELVPVVVCLTDFDCILDNILQTMSFFLSHT
jgi:hypothetical protein